MFSLSEWIKSIGDVLKRRIRRLKHSVNTRHGSILSDLDIVTELSRLHENFVIVPATLKKWGQSDVDPKEFKRIIRTSLISKFQPYHKHLVLWFFDPLHNHSSPET